MMRNIMNKTFDSFVSFCLYLLSILIFNVWLSSVPIHYKLLITMFSFTIIIAVLTAQPKDIVKAVEGGERTHG